MAILEKHRDVIIDHLRGFDEVLKYINELSGTMELKGLLVRAEALFKRFERTVEAVDKKQNFPAPGEGEVRRRRASGAANDTNASIAAASSSPSTGQSQPNAGDTSRSKSPRNAGGRTTQSDARPTSSSSAAGGGGEKRDKPQIITPQLRQLLDRKMIELPPLAAAGDGGSGSGAGDGRTRASGLRD